MFDRLRLWLLFVSCALFFTTGCGSSNQDFVATTNGTGIPAEATGGQPGGGQGGGPTDQPVNNLLPRMIDASVAFPQGTQVALDTLEIVSQLFDEPISADGKTRIAISEGGRVLAFVFDTNDVPLLAGFLTETQTEISVETTVQASLYICRGTMLLPTEVRTLFWDNVENLPGYAQLITDAEQLFAGNPLALQSDEYRDLIKTYIAQLDSNGVTARLISDGTIKSGLQIKEVPGDAINIVQKLRRRTHAFAYKVDTTDTEGTYTLLIPESAFSQGGSAQSIADFIVSPATAFNSAIGTMQTAVGGKGIELFAKESGTFDFSLELGERRATYAIRVVGPSQNPSPLTKIEDDKLNFLLLETFCLDYAFPVVMMALGEDSSVPAFTSNANVNRGLIDTIKTVLAAAPGAEENVIKGDYEAALRDLLDGFEDGVISGAFEGFVNAAAEQYIGFHQGAGKPLPKAHIDKLRSAGKGATRVLKGIDLFLQATDWARIRQAALSARMVEDFRVTVTENEVTLIPDAFTIIQGDRRSIKAVIMDGAATLGEGEAFVYKWSTTGNYGSLRDSVGNSGTSFSSSRDTVEYVAGGGTLPDNAVDHVNLEVFIKGPSTEVRVGEADPVPVRVRTRGFVITPEDLEVQGGNTVSLNVKFVDNSNPLNSSIFDYQFVWDTPAKFGRFDGVSASFTSETSNSVSYECLEKEKDGVETVSVSIYSKFKDDEGPFEFEDRVSTEIKVDNDPLRKIFYVENSTRSGGSRPALYFNWFVHNVYRFKPIENAIDYRLTVVENVPDARPSYVGTSSFWVHGNDDDLIEGTYLHRTNFTGGSTPFPESGQMSLDAARARYAGYKGLAKVVVRLRPPE